LALDAGGNVYVGDHGNGRVQKFTAGGAFLGYVGAGSLSYPQGVAVDNLGRVYVADVQNARVVRFRWDTNLSQYVEDYVLAGGMAAPVGVAVDGTGQTLYVSDYTAKRVRKHVWDGTQYAYALGLGRNGGDGTGGSGPGEFEGAAQVSLGLSGDLFVGDTNNHRIQRWHADGTFVRSYGSLGTGPGEFRRPHMAIEDAEGNLFISDTGNHRVQRLDAAGNVLAVIGRNDGDGTAGAGSLEFNEPLGLALAPNGTLYVSEVSNLRIQALHLGAVRLSGVVSAAKAGLAGVTVSALGLPAQTTTDAGGAYSLTVPGGWSGRVKPFLAGSLFTPPQRTVTAVAADTAGIDFVGRTAVAGYHTFVRAFASAGAGPGQLNRPWHIALDPAGNVYVADQNNSRVVKFSPDGTFLTMWGRNGGDGSAGSGDGEFNVVTGIVVDHAGAVYVGDYSNHRIQKFSGTGTFLGKWGRNGGNGSAGSGPGEFSQPAGLAVDAAGCIYVGEFGNGRVQKFDGDGNLLHSWATAAGHAVAVDGGGRVYLMNYQANTVWQYTWSSAAGTYQQTATWPVAGNPGGFCVDDAGTLYVAETWGSRVRRFSPDGTELTQWGSGGSGNGQFNIPCGVVVGSDGMVYVSDTGNNRIQQFVRTDGPPRTVTFLAGPGGALEGPTVQVLEQGTATAPVTAAPGPGSQFSRWVLDGALFSTDNPLTVAGVTTDMTIWAEFADILPPDPPTVTAGTGLITSVVIDAVSSEVTASGWDLRAVYLVDGSGLSGEPPVHAQIAFPGGTSWQTMDGSGTGSVTFDLQRTCDLARLHVWNLNFYAPYHGRGAREVAILTSLDAGDWTRQGTSTFPIATGVDGDPGFDLDASAWGEVRYVRFDILSNFGLADNAGLVGLSEVRFYREPQPGLPTWTWTSAGEGSGLFRIKLDDPDLTQGAILTTIPEWTPDAPLGHGPHTLYVQESDAAGDWSASGTCTIDVVLSHTVTYATDGTPGTGLTGEANQTVVYGGSATPVTAEADGCHRFVRWSDGRTDNPRTDTNVTADIAVTAEFARREYTLSYAAGAGGLVNGPTPQTVDCGNDGAMVSAEADPGYAFLRWSDGRTDNPRTDTNVTADITVTAEFVIDVYFVVFQADANGALDGVPHQGVTPGGSTDPVTAVPAYGFAFLQWSDGSTENPRVVTNVTANLTLTAQFAPATAVAPNGPFLAVVNRAAAAAGQGWWNVSGVYHTAVAGSALALTMAEDTKGKITGPAVLQVNTGKAIVPVNMPIKGAARGSAGELVVALALKGADKANGIAVSLKLTLYLDATTRQLSGPVTGTIRTPAGTTPVTDVAVLDIPAPMDGSWRLQFQLAQTGTAVTGTAILTLADGSPFHSMVKGKVDGQAVLASLAADPTDPLAKGLKIKASLTPLQGGWARLEAFSAKGYGQTLLW